jgi:hypothetical protein
VKPHTYPEQIAEEELIHLFAHRIEGYHSSEQQLQGSSDGRECLEASEDLTLLLERLAFKAFQVV